jgi:hypothetical protein
MTDTCSEIFCECEELVKVWESSNIKHVIKNEIITLICDNYQFYMPFLVKLKYDEINSSLIFTNIENDKFYEKIINVPDLSSDQTEYSYIMHLCYDSFKKSYFIKYVTLNYYIDDKFYKLLKQPNLFKYNLNVIDHTL